MFSGRLDASFDWPLKNAQRRPAAGGGPGGPFSGARRSPLGGRRRCQLGSEMAPGCDPATCRDLTRPRPGPRPPRWIPRSGATPDTVSSVDGAGVVGDCSFEMR